MPPTRVDDEVLEAALELVRAGAARRQHLRHAARSAGGCCALRDRSSRSTARCTAGWPARPRSCRASGTASRGRSVLVPPAFCELPVLLRVLRGRERARAEHAAPGRRRTAGSASTASSSPPDRCCRRTPAARRSVRLSMNVPCSVWPVRDRAGQLAFVARVVVLAGVRDAASARTCPASSSARCASRRRTTGDRARSARRASPRRSATACSRASCRALFSSGVSALHAGLVKFERNAPENRLPPLLVMTLTTPPQKRPYSAEMPEVSTWTSSIASSMNRLFGWPSTLSLMSTPSIRNTLS